MEPFSTNFRAPLDYSIPALAYGTELCEESPRCCIPGIDYRHFYNELKCPKVLMNVSVRNCMNLYVEYAHTVCVRACVCVVCVCVCVCVCVYSICVNTHTMHVYVLC